MKKNVIKIIGGIFLISVVSFTIWYFYQPSMNKSSHSYQKKSPVWQTINPVRATEFSSIKVVGKVKSNGFAVIAPRRAGIIQDLLVDIGDEVSKGQTIGSMLPEGVEGQSSAAIAEASARLQKARAELDQAKTVATEAVSVATKQWRESGAQVETKIALDADSQRQLAEKKSEGQLVATQAWESVKLLLFGTGANILNRNIVGSFSNSIQETKVQNEAQKMQRLEQTYAFESLSVVEHLEQVENFLAEVETLYKSAQVGPELTEMAIKQNLGIIQNQQLKVSQTQQAILNLEEKKNRSLAEQTEKAASLDRSRDMIDLVESQQNLSLTQAEKNVEVALANYNAALVKAGHQSITAPFSGTITARLVEVGEAVMTNKPLFYLENVPTARAEQAAYEIHFSVPESWSGKLAVGDQITVKTTTTGETWSAKIFRLSNQISLMTGSIMATAIIIPPTENESDEDTISTKLTHGQSLFVYLEDVNSQIFSVPTLSLKKRGSDYFLWKMVDHEPVQVSVELLAEDGEFSQIFSRELTLDDEIISNPSVSLFKQ